MSGKGDKFCGVGVMVKELCEKVVGVGIVSGRVMAVVVLVFDEDVLRLICGYAQQSGSLEGMQSFYDELKCE